MSVIEISFSEDIHTEDDIFKLFEQSDINVENAHITNWDALDEIIRDAVNFFSMHIILRGLGKADIDDVSRQIFMDIIKIDESRAKGSLTIRNFESR